MGLDYTGMKFWLDLVQVVATFGVWIYVWLSNRHSITSSRLAKLEEEMDKRLDGQGERISTLEGRVGNIPTHDDLDKMNKLINRIGGDLREMTGSYQRLQSTVDRIHDYMLNNKGAQ